MPKPKKPPPTPLRDLLVEMLDYEPETGALLWRIDWSHGPSCFGVTGTFAGKIRQYKDGYKAHVISLYGEEWIASRLIWLLMAGEWPKGIVDHKNGDPTDQRWSNLRDATKRQNARNRVGSSIRRAFLESERGIPA